ncbi:hypothetical protein PRMUPPPA20_20750 [Xylanibacter ruminicola]|uniref:ATP-grasp domain-containing protein n=2 Tax=Xylanibacter ruminicola TaxID=839 RepID=D5ET82_XYLR2|nr:hypothetical protein [Xylanibacter ruminicola]ADE83730.1 conserved hypothetical protein [Xylanibacter ruminicola 23]GJG33966.1 hypothetical protein PRMUPPPA20_20750 [Xylanibacter ruminicola]SEH65472.1 Predicted ATP-dependent carboligase, ATP-grasp superfamily [Xylanibacter ruminicola]
MSKQVFVVGGNHHNILGVMRSLGEKGVNSYVIIETKDKNPYVAKSRYIKQCWIVENEPIVLEVLRAEAGKHGDKPVIIACADNLSSLLDMHYDELSQSYSLPGSKRQGRVTELMDKEVMSKFASDVGFRVPLSIATDISKCDDDISIPLPWIIKPLMSKNGLKSDIERIYTIDDWNNYKSRHATSVQVQQLIDKDFEYQLIGLSLDSGSKVLIPGISHVIRPAATTNTGFLHFENLDTRYEPIVEKCKKFLRKAGYSGLFSMEFLRGKDGNDYFMEINFRNDGNAICVTAAGVNLPYIWYMSHLKSTIDIESFRQVRPVYVMPEFADVSLIRHGQLNIFTWIKDICRTDRYMEYDKKDPKPFWLLLGDFLKKFIFHK